MAGLRSQTQVCLNQNKDKLWSWGLGDFFSRRFSLAVDLTGDGVNVLKLGRGRFSDLITTMALGFFNPGQGLSFRTYRWQGPDTPSEAELHDPANEEGSTNYVAFFGKHIFIPSLPELAEVKAYYDWALAGLGGRGIGDEGWYGKLPYSVDHDVKVNTLLAAPLGFFVSVAFEWLLGYYWEKKDYVPYFGGYYAFPEGRGTRKTPAHSYLDLGVEKVFKLGEKRAVSVRLDVLNLLNSQQPVSYVKEDIPLFGSVWGRQNPRMARLMARFKW